MASVSNSYRTRETSEAADRRRHPVRGRRGESGQSRAEARRAEPRARSSEEEIARFKEIINIMQQDVKQAGDGGRGAERSWREEEERERGGRGRVKERRGRRAASEGGEESEGWRRLRWRVNELEKEKLQLTANHNQELCRLQAELARLRSTVERGEAQRVELQHQLTLSSRDAERVRELSRDKHTLTERAAELQQKVEELQKALNITRHAREEDQHALQQEVEERDRLIQSFTSESQRLHRLLQEQEEALQESERRITEVQKEREREAEATRRQADELKYLTEREERSRREKELCDQRVKSLESSIEAERAAHLESKFNSEIIQLRVRDLEAALAAERCGQQEAQHSLELLRGQFREVERAFSLERERRGSTERALERLQAEHEQSKADMSVALETEKKATSDLTERLEKERRRHANTHTQLEQAAERQRVTEKTFINYVTQIRESLQQHECTKKQSAQPAKDDGKRSPCDEVLQLLKATLSTSQHRLQEADTQVQELQQENRSLRQQASHQRSQIDESQQALVKQQEEVAQLQQEASDRSEQVRGLQAELQREREERAAAVQRLTEQHEEESAAQLSFLHRVYQRLLAGCVLLDQTQSIMGNFTWKELCDLISEQVDQLTSDLRKANEKIAHLQSVCDKKSVCVRELQHNQECVLSRLEESVRRREEAWSRQHTHTLSQLQLARSQVDSLRGRVSSLELRCSSLTSDLQRLQRLLSRSRREASSFFLACSLLSGTLRHAHRRLLSLSEQKTLLSRRLAARERLEEEVRRLADALGGDDERGEEEEGEERRRKVLRRWRRCVCAVLAVKRWRALAKENTVLFQLRMGGGVLSVCAGLTTATQKGQEEPGKDDVSESLCARWLCSKPLSSLILSSTVDLQRALAHTGSAPPLLIPAAQSCMSRLLDHLLDQSENSIRSHEDTLSRRLRLGLSRLTPPQPDAKALVSTLQQHFLLFSQRLHSAETERRSLRLEVSNLKRGLKQERQETDKMVAAERFHSVCVELRQALSREQEAQMLIQEQSKQIHTLRLRADTHTTEQADAQQSLSHNTQALSEAQQEVSRKERSLRILGKHLSGVQKERKQLEEKLQRAEEELREAARRKDCVISCMKAAEMNYKQVRDRFVQSQRSMSAQPRPLLLPHEHLELSGAESIMGDPEVAACQSLLSVVSQLCHACSSRIDWLEQEVSAHRSHVTALRSELQDACLRDNLAFVPVEFTESLPFTDEEKHQMAPLSDLPKVSLSPAPSQPLSKPTAAKTKNRKATKKSRGHVQIRGTDRKRK